MKKGIENELNLIKEMLSKKPIELHPQCQKCEFNPPNLRLGEACNYMYCDKVLYEHYAKGKPIPYGHRSTRPGDAID